ncbi:MAG: bifunctional glutamate N-acetyltransferase/amino-acid acetyltransferase ArgJ [Candidatus Omnitrophota bacterium]
MRLTTNAGILPNGFQASGISAKIKKSGKKDLALFISGAPCVASVQFSANRIQAAPLGICRRHLKAGSVRAIIANSGNANCMTGHQGVKDAEEMTALLANAFSLKKEEVLVASTGIIGKPLPMGKIRIAVRPLVLGLSAKGVSAAAGAILTTDTFAKEVCAKIHLGNKTVTVTGVAKGAGMIAPTLKSATMLAFIFTDARISKPVLDKALGLATDDSFNAITIDGCMSTNDMVIAMANGLAKNKTIKAGSAEERIFAQVLKDVCLALAKMIVRDAEGATKFIEINIRSAENDTQAKALAFSVANSNLFKCAMFGQDPNWGRIAAALGSVSSGLKWERLDISLNSRFVFRKGRPVACRNRHFLKDRNIRVDIDLHAGKAAGTVYTSDLSYGYVRINADYN